MTQDCDKSETPEQERDVRLNTPVTPSPSSSTSTPTCKKRQLCLYCERAFSSSNLRLKHVERCHAARRSSARTPARTNPPSCLFCAVKNIDLKKLFEHLVTDHANNYFGCLICSERFGSKELLISHNVEVHDDKKRRKAKLLNICPHGEEVSKEVSNFDPNFFSTVSYNIQENLQYHMDGGVTKRESAPAVQDLHITSPEEVAKYNFRSRKHKIENRSDVSKLDLWTQLAVKQRLQKHPEDGHLEELNRILDSRGPFEDLHVESDMRSIVDDILTNVFDKPTKKKTIARNRKTPEILNYFSLNPSSQKTKPPEEHPVELSGEWARPRMYVCGVCGLKIPNRKLLEDHKTFIHPHVSCVHYEFVGNQSEFYPHLNIPGLGRILENEKRVIVDGDVRNWEKSSARVCSKCGKQCNTLADLHRHMLECGGDWQWMMVKKKCKYRPYGGVRSRRKRMMELRRMLRNHGDSKRVERRINRSKLPGPRPTGPRPRPSDADTIERMLANLPPKRATRKIMCLKEVGLRKSLHNIQASKFKKDNEIKAANQKMKQALQHNLRTRNQLAQQSCSKKNPPRKTRKVLASKIIDSNTSIGPKSKVFSRKKTRFGGTIVTRLRNRILVAHIGDERVLRSRVKNETEKRILSSRLRAKPVEVEELPKTTRASRIEERASRIEERANRNEERASKNEERGTRIEERDNKNEEGVMKNEERVSKNEERVNKIEERITKTEEKVTKNEDKFTKKEEQVSKNEEQTNNIVEEGSIKNNEPSKVLETEVISLSKTNIDYCIDTVVADITGQVTYKEYPKGTPEKFKRKRVISTQTDNGIDEAINAVVERFAPADTISDTIEEVIMKYCVSDSQPEPPPVIVPQPNFPAGMLDAVGPPDNVVTFPILLPVVSHAIIQSHTNLFEQMMAPIQSFPKPTVQKPKKKLNDCINMLKQKLLGTETEREILKIPTFKPPIFSDHTIKKVTEAPFHISHPILDDEQNEPIDLSRTKPDILNIPKIILESDLDKKSKRKRKKKFNFGKRNPSNRKLSTKVSDSEDELPLSSIVQPDFWNQSANLYAAALMNVQNNPLKQFNIANILADTTDHQSDCINAVATGANIIEKPIKKRGKPGRKFTIDAITNSDPELSDPDFYDLQEFAKPTDFTVKTITSNEPVLADTLPDLEALIPCNEILREDKPTHIFTINNILNEPQVPEIPDRNSNKPEEVGNESSQQVPEPNELPLILPESIETPSLTESIEIPPVTPDDISKSEEVPKPMNRKSKKKQIKKHVNLDSNKPKRGRPFKKPIPEQPYLSPESISTSLTDNLSKPQPRQSRKSTEFPSEAATTGSSFENQILPEESSDISNILTEVVTTPKRRKRRTQFGDPRRRKRVTKKIEPVVFDKTDLASNVLTDLPKQGKSASFIDELTDPMNLTEESAKESLTEINAKLNIEAIIPGAESRNLSHTSNLTSMTDILISSTKDIPDSVVHTELPESIAPIEEPFETVDPVTSTDLVAKSKRGRKPVNKVIIPIAVTSRETELLPDVSTNLVKPKVGGVKPKRKKKRRSKFSRKVNRKVNKVVTEPVITVGETDLTVPDQVDSVESTSLINQNPVIPRSEKDKSYDFDSDDSEPISLIIIKKNLDESQSENIGNGTSIQPDSVGCTITKSASENLIPSLCSEALSTELNNELQNLQNQNDFVNSPRPEVIGENDSEPVVSENLSDDCISEKKDVSDSILSQHFENTLKLGTENRITESSYISNTDFGDSKDNDLKKCTPESVNRDDNNSSLEFTITKKVASKKKRGNNRSAISRKGVEDKKLSADIKNSESEISKNELLPRVRNRRTSTYNFEVSKAESQENFTTLTKDLEIGNQTTSEPIIEPLGDLVPLKQIEAENRSTISTADTNTDFGREIEPLSTEGVIEPLAEPIRSINDCSDFESSSDLKNSEQNEQETQIADPIDDVQLSSNKIKPKPRAPKKKRGKKRKPIILPISSSGSKESTKFDPLENLTTFSKDLERGKKITDEAIQPLIKSIGESVTSNSKSFSTIATFDSRSESKNLDTEGVIEPLYAPIDNSVTSKAVVYDPSKGFDDPKQSENQTPPVDIEENSNKLVSKLTSSKKKRGKKRKGIILSDSRSDLEDSKNEELSENLKTLSTNFEIGNKTTEGAINEHISDLTLMKKKQNENRSAVSTYDSHESESAPLFVHNANLSTQEAVSLLIEPTGNSVISKTESTNSPSSDFGDSKQSEPEIQPSDFVYDFEYNSKQIQPKPIVKKKRGKSRKVDTLTVSSSDFVESINAEPLDNNDLETVKKTISVSIEPIIEPINDLVTQKSQQCKNRTFDTGCDLETSTPLEIETKTLEIENVDIKNRSGSTNPTYDSSSDFVDSKQNESETQLSITRKKRGKNRKNATLTVFNNDFKKSTIPESLDDLSKFSTDLEIGNKNCSNDLMISDFEDPKHSECEKLALDDIYNFQDSEQSSLTSEVDQAKSIAASKKKYGKNRDIKVDILPDSNSDFAGCGEHSDLAPMSNIEIPKENSLNTVDTVRELSSDLKENESNKNSTAVSSYESSSDFVDTTLPSFPTSDSEILENTPNEVEEEHPLKIKVIPKKGRGRNRRGLNVSVPTVDSQNALSDLAKISEKSLEDLEKEKELLEFTKSSSKKKHSKNRRKNSIPTLDSINDFGDSSISDHPSDLEISADKSEKMIDTLIQPSIDFRETRQSEPEIELNNLIYNFESSEKSLISDFQLSKKISDEKAIDVPTRDSSLQRKKFGKNRNSISTSDFGNDSEQSLTTDLKISKTISDVVEKISDSSPQRKKRVKNRSASSTCNSENEKLANTQVYDFETSSEITTEELKPRHGKLGYLGSDSDSRQTESEKTSNESIYDLEKSEKSSMELKPIDTSAQKKRRGSNRSAISIDEFEIPAKSDDIQLSTTCPVETEAVVFKPAARSSQKKRRGRSRGTISTHDSSLDYIDSKQSANDLIYDFESSEKSLSNDLEDLKKISFEENSDFSLPKKRHGKNRTAVSNFNSKSNFEDAIPSEFDNFANDLIYDFEESEKDFALSKKVSDEGFTEIGDTSSQNNKYSKNRNTISTSDSSSDFGETFPSDSYNLPGVSEPINDSKSKHRKRSKIRSSTYEVTSDFGNVIQNEFEKLPNESVYDFENSEKLSLDREVGKKKRKNRSKTSDLSSNFEEPKQGTSESLFGDPIAESISKKKLGENSNLSESENIELPITDPILDLNNLQNELGHEVNKLPEAILKKKRGKNLKSLLVVDSKQNEPEKVEKDLTDFEKNILKDDKLEEISKKKRKNRSLSTYDSNNDLDFTESDTPIVDHPEKITADVCKSKSKKKRGKRRNTISNYDSNSDFLSGNDPISDFEITEKSDQSLEIMKKNAQIGVSVLLETVSNLTIPKKGTISSYDSSSDFGDSKISECEKLEKMSVAIETNSDASVSKKKRNRYRTSDLGDTNLGELEKSAKKPDTFDLTSNLSKSKKRGKSRHSTYDSSSDFGESKISDLEETSKANEFGPLGAKLSLSSKSKRGVETNDVKLSGSENEVSKIEFSQKKRSKRSDFSGLEDSYNKDSNSDSIGSRDSKVIIEPNALRPFPIEHRDLVDVLSKKKHAEFSGSDDGADNLAIFAQTATELAKLESNRFAEVEKLSVTSESIVMEGFKKRDRMVNKKRTKGPRRPVKKKQFASYFGQRRKKRKRKFSPEDDWIDIVEPPNTEIPSLDLGAVSNDRFPTKRILRRHSTFTPTVEKEFKKPLFEYHTDLIPLQIPEVFEQTEHIVIPPVVNIKQVTPQVEIENPFEKRPENLLNLFDKRPVFQKPKIRLGRKRGRKTILKNRRVLTKPKKVEPEPEQDVPQKITITFKKVSKLNSAIGLQLTDFENVQIITKPKDTFEFKEPETFSNFQAKRRQLMSPSRGDETDEERAMPLAQRLAQKFQFKSPFPVARKPVADETTDEEADVPLAKRFHLKPVETDGWESDVPLARFKSSEPKVCEETDGESELPLASRIQPNIYEETDGESELPLASRMKPTLYEETDGESELPLALRIRPPLCEETDGESEIPLAIRMKPKIYELTSKIKPKPGPGDETDGESELPLASILAKIRQNPPETDDEGDIPLAQRFKIDVKRNNPDFENNNIENKRQKTQQCEVQLDRVSTISEDPSSFLKDPTPKKIISIDNTENYCEICNKKFCRPENLAKHKMTLTHIAKLSELEAKETATRDSDDDETASNFEVGNRDIEELALRFIARTNPNDDDSVVNSNDEDYNLDQGINYPDLITSHQPKPKYRSMGERKSFDEITDEVGPPAEPVFDYQNARKTLNRDEELFLECCNLLKSKSRATESSSLGGNDWNNEGSPDWLTNRVEPEWVPEPPSLVEVEKPASPETIPALDVVEPVNETPVNNGSSTLPVVTKLELIEDEENYNDTKKVLTKGALKIFEGIKVSIPTEELNLPPEVLNPTEPSLKLYKNGVEVSKNILKIRQKRKKRANCIKTIFTKRRTKKILKKPSAKAIAKTKDVYDFEDSQDELVDDLKPFRDKKSPEKIPEPPSESESDNHDYIDAFSVDESSHSSDLKNENKKTMIMGRIFKNAVKPTPEAKDVNTLFDSLLTSSEEPIKKNPKKRTARSESDDEFCLKSRNPGSFNLEQEIRECIGVAGRKSQRKCTSGKQNILVEFWSSDEQSDVEKPPVAAPILKENANPAKQRRKKINQNRKTKPKPNKKVEKVEKVEEKVVNKVVQKSEVGVAVSRRKRSASEKLYYWSSSSDDEFEDLIEVKPVREDHPDDDRPMHHGWIVGDSPKKLVTMLAQAKGKKVDAVYVKEQVKRNRATL